MSVYVFCHIIFVLEDCVLVVIVVVSKNALIGILQDMEGMALEGDIRAEKQLFVRDDIEQQSTENRPVGIPMW